MCLLVQVRTHIKRTAHSWPSTPADLKNIKEMKAVQDLQPELQYHQWVANRR